MEAVSGVGMCPIELWRTFCERTRTHAHLERLNLNLHCTSIRRPVLWVVHSCYFCMTVWCQSTHKTEIVSVGSAAESAEIPFFLGLNAGGCGGVWVCVCVFSVYVCV